MEKPTPEVVIALTGTELGNAVVSSIIDDAALIAGSCIKDYSPERQEAIIKWLSAHLLASTSEEGVLTSTKLGDASDSFARAALGDALKGTTYGQQVLLLDLNGCLARKGRATASIEPL